MKWLLFVHHLPPRPLYLRAMVLRRLRALGALALKNSCYLLPDQDSLQEDLRWLGKEIEGQGGAAWILRAEMLGGLTAGSVTEAFRQLHAPACTELLRRAKTLLSRGARAPVAGYRKLVREVQALERIAYFGAPGKEELEEIMKKIEQILHRGEPETASPPLAELHGRTWVTRTGVKVDRMASAWLIKRFIDPDCRFRFVDPEAYKHRKADIRFDMYEGEFTHRGDLCTFEVLQAFFSDAALRVIAEMVHDIDCKDDKFRRTETAGLRMLINGIVARQSGDDLRLSEGMVIFDALYAEISSSLK
ncbi:MAG: chromate resistance protein [Acidobacteria bacterium]|nr:chromate resistance protein [Acidobacteriota bacterium]